MLSYLLCTRAPCDSGAGGGVACLPQCLKALCDFRRIHSHHTHVINYRLLLRTGLHGCTPLESGF